MGNRREFLKMLGVGSAGLILPKHDLVIPAETIDDQRIEDERFNRPIFITGDHVNISSCIINETVYIVGSQVSLIGCHVETHSGDFAVNVKSKDSTRILDLNKSYGVFNVHNG